MRNTGGEKKHDRSSLNSLYCFLLHFTILFGRTSLNILYYRYLRQSSMLSVTIKLYMIYM